MTSPDDPLHPETESGSVSPRSSILKNVAWSTFFLVFSKVIRFIAIAYCVRKLGTYSWGEIAATLVTVGFLYYAVDQGLGTAPTLHKVGDRTLDGIFLKRIGLYRFCMAILIIAGVHLFDRLVFPLNPLVLLYSFALAPRALSLDWWFQRREMFHISTGMSCLRIVLFFLGTIAFVKQGDSPRIVLYLELGVEILGCLAGYLLYLKRREKPSGPILSAVDMLGYADLVRIAFPYFIIGLLNTIHQSVDIVFLQHMCGFKDVGEYDMGYRIGVFLFFVGGGIVQVLRPKLARMYGEGRHESISDVLASTAKILAALGCIFMIISLYFADEIISLVFKDAGPLTLFVFRWAPVWVATSFMTILCADTLLSLGEKSRYLRGALFCALANIGANFLLIGHFGARGAIFATLFAEAVFFAYSFAWLPASLRKPIANSLIAQICAIGAILLLFLASTHWGSKTPFLLASLAVFAAMITIQGTVKRKTLSVLSRN